MNRHCVLVRKIVTKIAKRILCSSCTIYSKNVKFLNCWTELTETANTNCYRGCKEVCRTTRKNTVVGSLQQTCLSVVLSSFERLKSKSCIEHFLDNTIRR